MPNAHSSRDCFPRTRGRMRAVVGVVGGGEKAGTVRIDSRSAVVGGAGLAMLAASIAFRVDQSAAGGALDDNCGADRTACPASYDFMSDRAREERSFGLFLGFGAGGIVALGAAAIGLF